MGDSMSWTSWSISVRKLTVTSRSPLKRTTRKEIEWIIEWWWWWWRCLQVTNQSWGLRVVLGQQAEGDRGHGTVAPAFVEHLEQVAAILHRSTGKSNSRLVSGRLIQSNPIKSNQIQSNPIESNSKPDSTVATHANMHPTMKPSKEFSIIISLIE